MAGSDRLETINYLVEIRPLVYLQQTMLDALALDVTFETDQSTGCCTENRTIALGCVKRERPFAAGELNMMKCTTPSRELFENRHWD